MESFKYLAALYDHDLSLPIYDRIDLYAKLINEPLIKDDIISSIKILQAELRKNKDIISLAYLNSACNLTHYKSLFYDHNHNVHAFKTQSSDIANRIIARWPAIYHRYIDHPFIDEIEKMGLTDLFASIFKFIQQSKHKSELMKRLYEEMDDGKGTCTTGHMCRLINVVRGYINKNFEIKMSDDTYDKNIVFHHLNTKVDMTDPSRILHNIKDIIASLRYNELKNISDKSLIKYICEYTREDEDIIIKLLK